MNGIEAPLKRALRVAPLGAVSIKGSVASEPNGELLPGYSASGQDVWLDHRQARFKGDGLVLSTVGARCGKVFYATGRWGVVANTTVLLPEPGYSARFLWYLTNDETFWDRGVTAQPYVRTSETMQRSVHLPSHADQQRVAAFLDEQVGLLDSAVLLLDRQLLLFKEAHAERIRSSVLGLGEKEDRIPTGTKWISSIPSSWTVQPLGRVFQIKLGKMLTPDRTSGDSMKPYLRNTNIQWDRVETHDLLMMNFPISEQPRYRVLPGDLLVCEGGEVGRAAIWTGSVAEIYYQKVLHRLRPLGTTSARWAYYLLRAATQAGVFTAETETTITHLTAEQLRAHRFPIAPPPTEQRLIAALDRSAKSDLDLAQLIEKQKSLLRERRQALITAAVTGQLDVTTARSGLRVDVL